MSQQEDRMKWFHEARFGIYVHYGLYSILGRGEWTMYSERIPAAEYAALSDQFRPEPGCAKEWVEAAVSAGAKYMVLTTHHHEGFCLFDSKYSDFTSVKRGPKRDLVREYTEAARAAGLRVGLYYSLLDWRFPGYFEPEKYPESRDALLAQVHNQVRELMTNYGKIDLLEYDGGWDARLKTKRPQWAEFWHSADLNAMVRKLQPGIIINDRSGTDEDIVTNWSTRNATYFKNLSDEVDNETFASIYTEKEIIDLYENSAQSEAQLVNRLQPGNIIGFRIPLDADGISNEYGMLKVVSRGAKNTETVVIDYKITK